jgi:hypothetical protein
LAIHVISVEKRLKFHARTHDAIFDVRPPMGKMHFENGAVLTGNVCGHMKSMLNTMVHVDFRDMNARI